MKTADPLRIIVFRVRKQWDYCYHVLICMVKIKVRSRVLQGPITRAVNPHVIKYGELIGKEL